MPLDGDVTLIDVPTWLDLLTIVVAALGGALFAARRGSRSPGFCSSRWLPASAGG